jgi:hypothetical protein
MKRITLTLLITLLFSSYSFAQKETALELANKYLREKGEVIIRFKATSKEQFHRINEVVSVGHQRVDENELEVEAYANKDQFQRFLAFGLDYRVTAEDNEIPQEFTQYSTQAVNAWDTTWDAYPRYSEYVAKMNFWATTYPNLCTLQNIGTTPNGRALLVLKISDNVSNDETEPEFFYTSSMHGDEITGYPTMLRLIDYLLTNYGSLSEVTNLVNGTELYINPLANPDGSYRAAGNDIFNSSGNAPTRANANGIDLNRNYPDAIGGLHADNAVYQPETRAFLNFQATRNFVLSANYHGGTEVINFPLDTSNTPGTGNFSFHPHDNYFKFVSIEYAQLCQTADNNLDYMDAVYNTGQFPGTTNGAAWYSVYGGRQDCSNYFDHNKEITVEISNAKTPAASTLPFFWDRNRQALLNYVKQASYGLHGVVTDQSGNPIHAKVYVGGTVDNFGAWVETSPTLGDYHKVQIAGTYNVIFEAPGYATQTISVTLTNNSTTTLNVVMVPTTSIPTASDVTRCTGQTAALTATGTGTISWYSAVNATTPVATGANYTTPALTSTTSYWVEREVTPANLGPATVSGTGVSNTTLANRYLIFNCTTPTKLKSVMVSISVVGDLYVELQNSSGVMLESKVIRPTATGSQDIQLDFFLPAQNGLRLVSRQISGTSNNLTRATTGITYPISNGTVSITGNSGTGTFFQFFNWKFGAVKSNRDEVVVTVTPNPTNTSVSPNTRIAGSGAFTLTVTGTNFISGQSIVRWNGANRTTTFVSSTQLTAAISAADISTAGTANVTVFNNCNSTTSEARTVTITTTCTAPVPNITNLPNVTAQCSATVTPPTATSNCYGQITATTTFPLSYNTQGTHQIYWNYNDGNGNTSGQFQTVIINDTTAPVPNITNLPNVTAQCTATLTPPTATDNCMGTLSATTSDPLTYSAEGSYNVIWTYTDNRGNQSFQAQTVVISDTIAPVPNVTNLPTITGQCSVTLTAPTATDNCSGAITATTANPTTYTTQGTFVVVWRYTDARGNFVNQNQTVTVNDTTAPVPNVTNLPTITGQCSVTLIAPTATDNCSGAITATTANPTTYTTQGTFVVVWRYTDAKGNFVNQNQTVTINDTTAPVPNVTNLPTITGQCSVTLTAPTATDNCAGTVTATTTSPFIYIFQGTYTITWTYNDGNGNTSSQDQTIIIDDTTAPIPNIANLPTIVRQCSATLTAPTATDACFGSVTGTTNLLTYSNQGTYVITWTYTDAEGNSSTQQQTVIIDDTSAPIPTTNSLPTLTADCSVTVTVPTATDNCAGTINGTTESPLEYSSPGTYPITWTYSDGNGNTTTQTQTVEITGSGLSATYYIDNDGDGFGSDVATITACSTPEGYVDNDEDCDDAELQYEDLDGDGFGSTILAGCGVTNTTDCDDTDSQLNELTLYFIDEDGDGFGAETSIVMACSQPEGYVDNDGDCDDAELQYEDLDEDGFGSTILVGCGVTNNLDCDDSDAQINSLLTFYQDADADGWGTNDVIILACSASVGYVSNNLDCDDTQIQYQDLDGDGFGSTITAPCGSSNNTDCDDNNAELNGVITYYQDNDNDGFGDFTISLTTCFQPFGYVPNFNDCNDNEIQYEDLDEDGFGSTVVVGCGVLNSLDCNDNEIQYQDVDGDGFGSSNVTFCGVLNADDCDDTNSLYTTLQLYYQDLDGDGFGNTTVNEISCFPLEGYVLDNTDCNDAEIQYADNDNDGFGSMVQVACGVTNTDDLDDNDPNSNNGVPYYQDVDGDGFGNPAVFIIATTQPIGYVLDNTDCNDNQIQYVDNDNDGFGATTQVACGVDNNTDCNDNLLTYADADGDGFGSTTVAACGVTNSDDCDDTQITYADADNDGFGSTTQVACGVNNNSDCDDNLLTYADVDGDGFGSITLAACGVTNSDDCDDNALTYADDDNDGYGSTVLVPCGVSTNNDCDDTLLTYADGDGDGFGSPQLVACGGVSNSDDCDDNLLTYADVDGDGFGSTVLVACGITNSEDCNDNQIQYLDNDGDGFGSTTQVACGVSNSLDCNDNNATIRPLVLTTINQTISVPNVAGAQAYRFRVTNLTTNNVQTIERELRTFNLTQLSNYAYNTVFYVEFAVKQNDIWSEFSRIAPCSLITPSVFTRLQTSQCNITLTSLGTLLFANNVSFTSGYRFRITNTNDDSDTQTFDAPIRNFRFSSLTGIIPNTTYRVEVAVRNNDGTYLPYGTSCLITTPPSARIEQISNEELFNVIAAPNPFSATFSLQLENAKDDMISIQVYDMLGRNVENQSFNSNELDSLPLGNDYPTGVYTLIVTNGTNVKNIRIVKR